jgi:hypothetical protein
MVAAVGVQQQLRMRAALAVRAAMDANGTQRTDLAVAVAVIRQVVRLAALAASMVVVAADVEVLRVPKVSS